jgi:hypothetical protein
VAGPAGRSRSATSPGPAGKSRPARTGPAPPRAWHSGWKTESTRSVSAGRSRASTRYVSRSLASTIGAVQMHPGRHVQPFTSLLIGTRDPIGTRMRTSDRDPPGRTAAKPAEFVVDRRPGAPGGGQAHRGVRGSGRLRGLLPTVRRDGWLLCDGEAGRQLRNWPLPWPFPRRSHPREQQRGVPGAKDCRRSEGHLPMPDVLVDVVDVTEFVGMPDFISNWGRW